MKLLIRGAFVRYIDIRIDESGVYSRLHMSSDYTKNLAETMDWPEDIPARVKSGKLEGKLSASSLIITPNEKSLKNHEMEVPADQVSDFELVTIKNEDGESTSRELRFVVLSRGDGVWVRMGEYFSKVGKARGQMKLDAEIQENLNLQQGEAE